MRAHILRLRKSRMIKIFLGLWRRDYREKKRHTQTRHLTKVPTSKLNIHESPPHLQLTNPPLSKLGIKLPQTRPARAPGSRTPSARPPTRASSTPPRSAGMYCESKHAPVFRTKESNARRLLHVFLFAVSQSQLFFPRRRLHNQRQQMK